MEGFWTTGIIILAVVDAVLALFLLAFARMLGMLLARIGPATALPTPEGLKIGEQVEMFEVADIRGSQVRIGDRSDMKFTLLAFMSGTCPACSDLIPGLVTLKQSYAERLNVYAISSTDRTPQDLLNARRLGKVGIPYVCDLEVHKRFRVDGTPYSVLLDSTGTIQAKGVVNNLEHLESLIETEVYRLTKHLSQKRPSEHLLASSVGERVQ